MYRYYSTDDNTLSERITGIRIASIAFCPQNEKGREFRGVPPLKPSDNARSKAKYMYRDKEIKIRLTASELARLDRCVARTTMSREGYISED